EWRAPDNFVLLVADENFDPYSYVISANVRCRQLSRAGMQRLIDAVLAAQAQKPDNQIAKEVGVSPTTVGKRRKAAEARGDVSKVETRKDSKGREQPTRKPRAEPPAPKPAPLPQPEPEPEAPKLDTS